MDCFNDLLAIPAACDEQVGYQYSLKDVGITVSMLNDITGEEYDNGEAMAESRLRIAKSKLYNEIVNKFSGQIKVKTVLQNKRVGFPFEDNGKWIVPDAGKLKGIKLELNNPESHVKVYVSSLSLFLDTAGDYEVKVYDLSAGRLLDTLSVTAVADTPTTVHVNKEYSAYENDLNLAFLYNPNGAKSFQTQVDKGGCSGCGAYPKYRDAYIDAYAASIADGQAVTYSNIRGARDTGGLSVVYSIQCDHEAWICQFKNLLVLALLYKWTEEIALYAIHQSERQNSSNTVNMDIWQNRYNHYASEYENQINNVLANISIPDDRVCFHCNKRFKTVFSM